MLDAWRSAVNPVGRLLLEMPGCSYIGRREQPCGSGSTPGPSRGITFGPAKTVLSGYGAFRSLDKLFFKEQECVRLAK